VTNNEAPRDRVAGAFSCWRPAKGIQLRRKNRKALPINRACAEGLRRQSDAREDHEQAASIKNPELGGSPPGIKVNTSATDFAPLSQLQLQRFKGETWERYGEIPSSDTGGQRINCLLKQQPLAHRAGGFLLKAAGKWYSMPHVFKASAQEKPPNA
jgi:hypothetical protein